MGEGCFFAKSGPFLNAGCIMYTASISIFYFTFYLFGGVRPPCLRACSHPQPQSVLPMQAIRLTKMISASVLLVVFFTARAILERILLSSRVCLCLSVCLSHAGKSYQSG